MGTGPGQAGRLALVEARGRSSGDLVKGSGVALARRIHGIGPQGFGALKRLQPLAQKEPGAGGSIAGV
jgi:hypothetical protein